jgi:hypothetical protein
VCAENIAKGKGEMKTFWLNLRQKGSASVASVGSTRQSDVSVSDNDQFDDDSGGSLKGSQADFIEDTIDQIGGLKTKTYRSVQWTVQMLLPYLKKIVAMRDANEASVEGGDDEWFKVTTSGIEHQNSSKSVKTSHDMTVLDQCREVITLPSEAGKYKRNWEDIDLGPLVECQVESYVTTIASMYRNIPFHCFEHASHVTMSASKLLSRIVSGEKVELEAMTYTQQDQDDLHAYTYGITSDPLTQFAVIFSALIHDVDHDGVPNAQLVKEKSFIANIYKNRSVAEQNSVDLAWGLLMEPAYKEFRNCLCTTKVERERFRQLVVNSVMATDIADKELGALRRERWDKAFTTDHHNDENPLEDRNRKATIVIEHLIQAADVSHTMQHWQVYQVRPTIFGFWNFPFVAFFHSFSLTPIGSPLFCMVFVRNGIKSCLKRIIEPFWRVDWNMIPRTVGIKVNWVFLTFISFHWPKSFTIVECLVSAVMSI